MNKVLLVWHWGNEDYSYYLLDSVSTLGSYAKESSKVFKHMGKDSILDALAKELELLIPASFPITNTTIVAVYSCGRP